MDSSYRRRTSAEASRVGAEQLTTMPYYYQLLLLLLCFFVRPAHLQLLPVSACARVS